MGKYQGICLNRELIDLIDRNKKGHGYQSRADFVREAIREKIERMEDSC
jgi:metal-responsive CopG/Arc/MetJ family transcriptional regulator